MPRIVPFRALRFDSERLPETAKVIAPPYDVISADRRAEFEAMHERNIVHLDLPRGEGDAKYEHARKLLEAWLADGSLREDAQPALYRYEQVFTFDKFIACWRPTLSRSSPLTRGRARARIGARDFLRSSSFRPSRRAWCCPTNTPCRVPRWIGSSSSRPPERTFRRSSPSIAILRGWPKPPLSAQPSAIRRWTPPRRTAANTACGW